MNAVASCFPFVEKELLNVLNPAIPIFEILDEILPLEE